MKMLAWCSLFALSLSLATATHEVIGEPPQFMPTQHPNVYVYVNNSDGDPQNLVLPCPLMDTTNVVFEWFRLNLADPVSSEMVDQADGTLTVYNITEGEYASVEGVNYYCVATRFIGKGNYSASVRSRTIKVFYASFGGFQRMTEGDMIINVAIGSDVALECDVVLSSTNPPPQIVWRRGDNTVIDEILSNNRRRFLEAGRFLYISNLVQDDLIPTYRCEVTNAFLGFTRQAPSTYVLRDNLTRGVLEEYKQIGDLIAFVRNTSIEVAYVAGYFGTGQVNGTNNRLFQGDMRLDSNGNIGLVETIDTPGMFTLRADVTFDGVRRERFGALTIHQLPSITSSPSDDREIVEGQQNLVYRCLFEGSPRPAISWFFNGQVIDAESGVSINDNTLTIASPQVSNSGIYQCIVSNDFGDAQAAWLLEIRPSIVPAVVPYNFTELNAFEDRDLGALIVQENGTTVNFFINVMADPCPDITWFFNSTLIGPSNASFTYNNACAEAGAMSPNWRFELNVMLTEDTSGSYTARLSNLAESTDLTTPAYITVPAPVSVNGLSLSLPCLKEGQNVRLRCNINGFPRPVVSFTFDGNAITPGEGIYANSIQRTFYDEIEILNVDSSDEGLYGCMAEGLVESERYEFCTVPNITRFEVTSNPVVGSDFFVRCSARGTPRPTISWKRDGNPLEPTEDGVLRIVSTENLMTSSVEVSDGRLEFNGVYECIAMNPAGFANRSSRIQLQETNELPLSLGAIIGIAAGGVGGILLIALVILLLVCVYAAGKKTSTGKYSANPAHMHGSDFTDGRGNVDKDSDEEDGQPEAFNPQYESLPALRPAQPPSYKPTPSYPMGDDMEMVKVPLPDLDSYQGGGGGYMMQDNGMAFRPGVDDFLSEDAQFV